MSSKYLCNPLYYVEAMRHKHPEVLNDWCCIELSHVLDFSGSDGLGQVLAGVVDQRQGKIFTRKFSKSKQRAYSQGGVFGAPFAEEGYCQARQLIDFIKDYVTKEGIFRIPGNSERQRRLKDKISRGLLVDLNNDVFTPHDVACVLKTFLGDLPEPLLTDKHYPAHVQAAGLTYHMDQVSSLSEELGRMVRLQKIDDHITALRYLFLMLPPVNFKMLKEILELLYCIAEKEKVNKMSAFNLAVMFAPHILWPRYLTADDLRDQALINKLNCGVEFMIKHFHKIFKVPAKMLKACEQYMKHGQLLKVEDVKISQTCSQDECDGRSTSNAGLIIGTPQTPTVDLKKEQVQTSVALAELYANVQELPPSSKKRRLMKQFARNSNMPGTPTRVREDILLRSKDHNRKQHKHSRSKSVGDAVMKRAKLPVQPRKRRAAPSPPEKHEKTVHQRMHMRDVRHELRNQLEKTCIKPCSALSTTRSTCTSSSEKSRITRSPWTGSSGVSPQCSRQKRQAPLTPKQLEEQQLSSASKSDMTKSSVAAHSSVQTQQHSEGQLAVIIKNDGSTKVKPVPKPRKLKENSQVSTTQSALNEQQHELNSLV